MKTNRMTTTIIDTVALLGAGASQSQAATARSGGVCTKVSTKAGTKSKPLVCARTSKGLRWKSAPKAATKAADTTVAKAADTTIKKATDTTIKK